MRLKSNCIDSIHSYTSLVYSIFPYAFSIFTLLLVIINCNIFIPTRWEVTHTKNSYFTHYILIHELCKSNAIRCDMIFASFQLLQFKSTMSSQSCTTSPFLLRKHYGYFSMHKCIVLHEFIIVVQFYMCKHDILKYSM